MIQEPLALFPNYGLHQCWGKPTSIGSGWYPFLWGGGGAYVLYLLALSAAGFQECWLLPILWPADYLWRKEGQANGEISGTLAN
jgi:hypothetical protein